MIYYYQHEDDQCYQQTPYNFRRSTIQTYYEVEFYLSIISSLSLSLCLMFYVRLIVFVRSFFILFFFFYLIRGRRFVIHLSFSLLLFCQFLRIISRVAFSGLALPWTPAYPGFEMMVFYFVIRFRLL